jgi:hypothetical protein
MRGAIPPLPQYAFMVWCSVKKITGTTLALPIPYRIAYRKKKLWLQDGLKNMAGFLLSR